MSELLVGMTIGFLICWGVLSATEALYERRHPRFDPQNGAPERRPNLVRS
jgi:hypothetical protein